MRQDITIQTDDELQSVLQRVSFKNTVIDFGWRFRFRPIATDTYDRGWLLWAEFTRPDTHTGVIGTGRGRDEIVWRGASESSVVKTCWLLVELLVRHELMEGFRYEDLRIFDPHNTLGDLMLAQQVGSRVKDMSCTYMDQQAKAQATA